MWSWLWDRYHVLQNIFLVTIKNILLVNKEWANIPNKSHSASASCIIMIITSAIPERLRGVFTTRRYTNPRLPLPLPIYASFMSLCTANKYARRSPSTLCRCHSLCGGTEGDCDRWRQRADRFLSATAARVKNSAVAAF